MRIRHRAGHHARPAADSKPNQDMAGPVTLTPDRQPHHRVTGHRLLTLVCAHHHRVISDTLELTLYRCFARKSDSHLGARR